MKVLIAADRPVIAQGIALAIQADLTNPETETAGTIPQCLQLVEAWQPELAVVDVNLPLSDCQRLCAHLHDLGTRTVHVVTGADDALRLLEAGADGVVAHTEDVNRLVEALKTVMGGHTHVPPALLGGVLQGLIHRRRERVDNIDLVERLSVREREVLALLGNGLDQTGIARSLDISPQTAKTHIRHVLHKLGVRSRIEAAALALESGIPLPREGA